MFTSFTDNDISHLSKANPNFEYCTFAVCDDDTGNQFLQGFVSAKGKCYDAIMYREIGDNVIYDVIGGDTEYQKYIMTMIQLSNEPKEFGNIPGQLTSFVKELKTMKATILDGYTDRGSLARRYARI